MSLKHFIHPEEKEVDSAEDLDVDDIPTDYIESDDSSIEDSDAVDLENIEDSDNTDLENLARSGRVTGVGVPVEYEDGIKTFVLTSFDDMDEQEREHYKKVLLSKKEKRTDVATNSNTVYYKDGIKTYVLTSFDDMYEQKREHYRKVLFSKKEKRTDVATNSNTVYYEGTDMPWAPDDIVVEPWEWQEVSFEGELLPGTEFVNGRPRLCKIEKMFIQRSSLNDE